MPFGTAEQRQRTRKKLTPALQDSKVVSGDSRCSIERKLNLSDLDVLIVGQGLAGSCMAWALHWAGHHVIIVDRGVDLTASRIAAGLITPVTGRRMAPTHGYQESYRSAATFYRRATGIEMRDAARLNVPRFLDQTRQYFSSLGRYQQAELNPDTDIVINDSGVFVTRLNLRSACVVWCQGYQPKRNHWFPTIPDGPAKGEILRVQFSDYRESRVLHKGVWLVPDGDEASFLLGATYDRVNLNNEPTTAGREQLLEGLKHITAEIPIVIDHVAAIRAGMKRRKPIVGPQQRAARSDRCPAPEVRHGTGSHKHCPAEITDAACPQRHSQNRAGWRHRD